MASHAQLAQDTVIIKLKETLPDNWRISFKQDTLLITNDDSILVHFVNISFWTEETSNEFTEDFIRLHGTKKPVAISFKTEPKWTQDKCNSVNKYNDSILLLSERLAIKYNLTSLTQWNKWNQSGYIGRNKKEWKRISLYEKEKNKLLTHLKQTPSYSTAYLSLFHVETTWLSGMGHMWSAILPEEKMEELKRLNKLIIKVLSTEGVCHE